MPRRTDEHLTKQGTSLVPMNFRKTGNGRASKYYGIIPYNQVSEAKTSLSPYLTFY